MKSIGIKLTLLTISWALFFSFLSEMIQSSRGLWFMLSWTLLAGLATVGALFKAKQSMRIRRLLGVRRKIFQPVARTEAKKTRQFLNG